MKVWLVQVGEPNPNEEVQARLMRTGEIAKFLSMRGDDVTWWTSSFSHQKKKKFPEGEFDVALGKSSIVLNVVPSIGYSGHVSLRRLLDEIFVAWRIFKSMKNSSQPDLVVASTPTVLGSYAAHRYCKKYSVPLVLDVRDLWPDIFVSKSPKSFRVPARLLEGLIKLFLKKVVIASVGIMATSSMFVDWACRIGQISRRETDQEFPLLYDLDVRNYSDLNTSPKVSDLLYRIDDKRIVVYSGSFSSQFNFDSVMVAATRFQMTHPNVVFVFCGDGPKLRTLAESAPGNCVFMGWLGRDDLSAIMRFSSVAIAPYIQSADFQENIPNKYIEYLANGLPVVSSLGGGLVERMLEEHEVGSTVNLAIPGEWESALQKWLFEITNLQKVQDNCSALYRRRFDLKVVTAEIGAYLDQFV